MRHDPRTIAYIHKRQTEGKPAARSSAASSVHIAREIYHLLTNPHPTSDGTDLHSQRQQGGLTITRAAEHLNTHPTLISQLERGHYHNHQLATRYQQFLTRHPTYKT